MGFAGASLTIREASGVGTLKGAPDERLHALLVNLEQKARNGHQVYRHQLDLVVRHFSLRARDAKWKEATR